MENFGSYYVAWCLAAALASGCLAAMQDRHSLGWATASALLAGLPLVWLISYQFYGKPTRAKPAPQPRCYHEKWTAIADLGHAGGCDLDLGRCSSCGEYVMEVFYISSSNYVVIREDMAKYFLSLRGTPELRKALKDWVD